jgi:hypothetical protein
MPTNFDHAEKIHALTIVIKSLCEENNISKKVVVEDFIYWMNFKNDEVQKEIAVG